MTPKAVVEEAASSDATLGRDEARHEELKQRCMSRSQWAAANSLCGR